jgi:hypothetical protein
MLAGKDDKEAKLKALEAATRPTTVSPNPSGPSSSGGLGSAPSFGGGLGLGKPVAFGAAPAPGFGSAPSFGPAPFVASSGKLGPAQDPHPEI